MPPALRSIPAILLQNVAERSARKSSALMSRTMPASIVSMDGRMATVRIEATNEVPFPTITVPVLESEYARAPLQPGCKGLLLCSDVNIGHLSGMNSDHPDARATLTNLFAGIFIPFSNKNWDRLDGNVFQLYGVTGVQLNDKLHGSSTIQITNNKIVMSNGSATVTLDGGQIHLDGQVIINGQPYKAHTHSNGHNGAPTGGVL
ncbi:hypothetical protein PT277_05135 [Acetobacteraceae bacterium ESL0709]|nr:hypothetical protein [Acetobacteraceae bacterium ESL0697]MDF7678079.1 hypothetical protein [Acetobacteraceae bacterium ESL0709]